MRAFFNAIYEAYLTFCRILFVIMIVITGYTVLGRLVLKSSPAWGEELVLMCMVYMALVSAALAIKTNSHIRISLLDYVLPKKAIAWLDLLAYILMGLFSVFMIVGGGQYAMLMRNVRFTGLDMSSMWLYMSVPIAGIAMLLIVIEKIGDWFLNGGEEEENA